MPSDSPKNLILRTILVIGLLILLIWLARRNHTVTVDSGYRQVMGTIAHILVVADSEQHGRDAIEQAFTKIRDIESRMSDYDPNSLLSKVNRQAFTKPIPVDDELFEVLTAAVQCSRLTDGAFDITVAPVVQLWRNAKKTGIVPDEAAIQKARGSIGYQNLILDPANKTVRFAKSGMALDLGGIAKGFAIDKALETVQQSGMAGGMVDIGGDLRCFGTAPKGSAHWLIGLQDPLNDEHILLRLKMDDRAVATSGDYRRFVVINGVKHSHIVNPATADSAQTLSSVSVIAATAMQADALATAVSVLGDKKGMTLIETILNVEAILIPHGPDEEIEKTPAADQYIQK